MIERTNEELADLIKSGKEEYTEQLWLQCERFIALRAARWFFLSGKSYPEVDDLKSAGYFAMLEAVRYFDKSKGFSFLTYLTKTLKKAFQSESGIRAGRNDALSLSVSIDEPTDEDGNITLGDTLADEDAEKELNRIVDDEYIEYSRSVIADAFAHILNESERRILCLIYFEGLNITEAGAVVNQTKQNADRIQKHALWKLRRCSYTNTFRELIHGMPEFDGYNEGLKCTSLQYFRETGISSVERAAMKHIQFVEDLRRYEAQKETDNS